MSFNYNNIGLDGDNHSWENEDIFFDYNHTDFEPNIDFDLDWRPPPLNFNETNMQELRQSITQNRNSMFSTNRYSNQSNTNSGGSVENRGSVANKLKGSKV